MGLGLNVKITVPILSQNNGFTSYKEVELVVLKGIEGPVGNANITHSFTYKPPAQATINRFVQFESGINACINSGELVNRKLLELITLINRQHIYESVEVDYKKKSSKKVEELDFMGLRDEFSELLKKSRIVRQKLNITSNSQVKPLTSTLHRFIQDRNIYTHGKLAFAEDQDQFVIESKDPVGKQMHYSYLTQEIVQSFLSCTQPFVNIINEIKAIYPANPGPV
jgi:hypothetical protein